MTTKFLPRRSVRRSFGLAAACAGLVLGGAACGDDDDDAADKPFCTAGPAVDAALAPDEPDPATVEKALAAAEAAAPDDLADDVKTAADAVRKALETENFDLLSADEVTDAVNELDDYYVDECDFEQLKLTAQDYAFQGVPKQLDAGPAVIRLSNKGKELHEAIVLRIKDDAGMSLDEILELDEEEAMTKVDQVGESFSMPGSYGSSTATLTKGDYAVVCFIPKGLTKDVFDKAQESGEFPEGPPHFTLGMVAEFSVD